MDFIILCFPESKVTSIFEILYDEGSITKEVKDSKLEMLKLRIRASKFSYKELFDANFCFQVIAQHLMKHLKVLNKRNKAMIQNTISYLQSG